MRWMWIVVLGLMGCGASGEDEGTAAGACDYGTNPPPPLMPMPCTDYIASEAYIATQQADCQSAGGTWRAVCSHYRAMGGCRSTSSGGAVITSWAYYQTPQPRAPDCLSTSAAIQP